MNDIHNNTDIDRLWENFSKTGKIGAYLSYRKAKADSQKSPTEPL